MQKTLVSPVSLFNRIFPYMNKILIITYANVLSANLYFSSCLKSLNVFLNSKSRSCTFTYMYCNSEHKQFMNIFLKGDFFLFMCDIQHYFIWRPSDSSVSEDAGIEPRTVATKALTVRRSNHSARSLPYSARSYP
jgi:hypothetical protein